MTLTELLRLVVPVLLSGSLIASLVAVYTARRKVPAETDSLIVTGAETAVATLERSLAAETRRADRAEARVRDLDDALLRKDERIERLEGRLDALQRALDDARAELHRILTEPLEEQS